jgi:OmpA-OmpF porin, OOP family
MSGGYRLDLTCIARVLWFVAVTMVAPTLWAADASSTSKHSAVSQRRDDPARELQSRLKDQIAKGASIDSYAVALAYAWIEYGRESYYRKDRLAAKEALNQAGQMIELLERDGDTARAEARMIPSARRLRDDLWQRAAAVKQDRDFPCAIWQIARMEIALVAAGRADNDLGWRAARPFIKRAERFNRDADEKISACVQAREIPKEAPKDIPKQPSANTEGAVSSQPNAPEVSTTAKEAVMPLSLPDRIHFLRESAELSDVSALVLEQVSYVMRANPAIVLDLYGSAYEFNDAAKNDELAMARALAVRDYLVETGVGKERFAIKTKAVIVADDTPALERAKQRRVEFVPTQSETIPVEYQDKDLITEGQPSS